MMKIDGKGGKIINKYMKKEPTEADFDAFWEKLKAKDPKADLMVEYGKLLMIHINDFTEEQKVRFKELENLLK